MTEADNFFTKRRGMIRQRKVDMLSYEQWRAHGLKMGWVGPAVCITHDGYPTTELEDIAFDEGDDPCIHMQRMYVDHAEARAVEENHSPSQWRKDSPSLL